MSWVSNRVLVVGADVFGVTAALELLRRGYRVALLDPGPLPHSLAASTDISKTICMDYGADEMYMNVDGAGPGALGGMERTMGEELYHQDGCLFMLRGPMAPGTVEHDSRMLLQKRGHRAIRMDAAELKRRFPGWAAENYPDGYLNPRGGWAESGKVVARLLDEARLSGVEVREGQAFGQLLARDARVGGIVTGTGETLPVHTVVMATGAWTPTRLPDLSAVMWATGQPVFHLKPGEPENYRAPRFCQWAADVSRTGWYGFPANAGGILKIANHGPGRPVHPDGPRHVMAETEPERDGCCKSVSDGPLGNATACDARGWPGRHGPSRACLYRLLHRVVPAGVVGRARGDR